MGQSPEPPTMVWVGDRREAIDNSALFFSYLEISPKAR